MNGSLKTVMTPGVHEKVAYGSWFDYTKDWENVKKTMPSLPILTLNYEDLKENTCREAKKLCDFLMIERDDIYIQQVCDLCEFQSMKGIKKVPSTEIEVYRKGEVGDWKNWFTVAQNEWFDQLYQEKMKDCPLKFRYTLD